MVPDFRRDEGTREISPPTRHYRAHPTQSSTLAVRLNQTVLISYAYLAFLICIVYSLNPRRDCFILSFSKRHLLFLICFFSNRIFL